MNFASKEEVGNAEYLNRLGFKRTDTIDETMVTQAYRSRVGPAQKNHEEFKQLNLAKKILIDDALR